MVIIVNWPKATAYVRKITSCEKMQAYRRWRFESLAPWRGALRLACGALGLDDELDDELDDVLDDTCFFALPNSVWFTCLAKRSEHSVSPPEAVVGETLTIIIVFPWPLKQLCIRYVNFELRNGTWLRFLDIASNTSTRADKLLLMAAVSFAAAPVAPDRFRRSEPARSTN